MKISILKRGLTLCALVQACCLLPSFGALPPYVVYQNDFTRRESSEPIPRMNEWFEATPYATEGTKESLSRIYPYVFPEDHPYRSWGEEIYGKKRLPCFAYLYEEDEPVFGNRACQDGWHQTDFGDGGYQHRAGIVYEKGNPCFRFYYSTTSPRRGYAFHQLHNLFTNGVLRMQVDMRAPLTWDHADKIGTPVFAFPVFDKYMDIEAWDASNHPNECCPGAVGLRSSGSKTGNFNNAFPQYYDFRKYDDESDAQLGNNYNKDDPDKQVYWFRFVVDYDLDNATFSGTVKSLSEFMERDAYDQQPHPTFDSEVTTAKSATIPKSSKIPAWWVGCTTNAQGKLATDMMEFWKDRRGISGIGFAAGFTKSMSLSGLETITNKVLIDNVRISWKRPGGSDFELAYENDFATRKYRTLSYPTSCTGDYAATTTTATTIDFFTDYPHPSCKEKVKSPNYKIIPSVENNTTIQGIGCDGWRRLYMPVGDGNAHAFTVVNAHTDGEVNTMMQMSYQGQYCCVGNLIGTKVTSGKVGISVDAFLPLAPGDYKLPKAGGARIGIALGEEAAYTDLPANHLSHLAAACGFNRVWGKGFTNDVPYRLESATLTDSTEIATKGRWYRLKMSVDLDAKTYDSSIQLIGDTTIASTATPTGEVLCAASSIAFAANVANIAALHLWGYGYGDTLNGNENRRGAFTNVRIYQIGDEGTETPLYSNDFGVRRRYDSNVPEVTSRLAYQYDRDDGPDGWIRRNGNGMQWGGALATVRDDGGNQFLSLGRDSSDGLMTQYTTPLGKRLTSGTVKVQADLRAPTWWSNQTGALLIGIGNKAMEQSQIMSNELGRVAQFGLAYRGQTEVNMGSHYENVTPVAVGTDGYVDAPSGTFEPSKWYRMLAKLNLRTEKYSVLVYEMGENHPTLESSPGTLVARIDDVPFGAEIGEGLSAIDIYACGAGKTVGETGLDPLQAAIDNIQVSNRDSGFLLFVQ